MDFWELLKNWGGKLGNFALDRLLPAIILLVIGIFAVRLILSLLQTMLKKTKLDDGIVKLARRVLKVALYFLLLLIVASRLGLDVTGVVALASVLTLAISLSVQTALTNVIGGFTLLNTKPFVAGDFVEIAGRSGTVKDVGLTYTKLATPDNKIVSIPNSAVVATEIVNFSTTGTRRVDIAVSVENDAQPQLVLDTLRECADLPFVLKEPAITVGVNGYKESATEYSLLVWCKSGDYWTCHFELHKKVKEVFTEKGIRFAYPHMNVHVDK